MGVTASKKREPGICKICGESFIKVSRNNIYCSRACRNRAQSDIDIENRRDKREKRLDLDDVCLFCKEPITQTSKYRPRKFCSKKCAASFHKRKYKLMRIKKSKPLQKQKKVELEEDRYKYHCFFCPMRGWQCRESNVLPCYRRSKLNKEYREKIEYWNSLADV